MLTPDHFSAVRESMKSTLSASVSELYPAVIEIMAENTGLKGKMEYRIISFSEKSEPVLKV